MLAAAQIQLTVKTVNPVNSRPLLHCTAQPTPTTYPASLLTEHILLSPSTAEFSTPTSNLSAQSNLSRNCSLLHPTVTTLSVEMSTTGAESRLGSQVGLYQRHPPISIFIRERRTTTRPGCRKIILILTLYLAFGLLSGI